MTAQSFLDDTALKTRYVILPFHHCSLLDRLPCRYSTRARRRVVDLLRYAVLPTLSTLAREEPRERVESPTASTRPLLLHYIMFYDDAAPSICYDAAPLTLLRLFYSTSLRYEVERSDTILRRGWPNGAARSPDLVSRGGESFYPYILQVFESASSEHNSDGRDVLGSSSYVVATTS